MSRTNYEQPGDILLHDITLTPVDGDIAILNNIEAELNIHEDFTTPFMYGSILLHDSNNLLMELPITGQEEIKVQFKLVNEPESKVKQTFQIYKISDLFNDVSINARNYILHFVSMESYKNEQKFIQQSFVSKTISEIVKIIFDQHLKIKKDIEIEATSGIQNLIIPNLSPVKAIQWLAKRAYSSENPSSNFMFWEDHKNFNFKTIDSLIDEEPKEKYYYGPANAIINKELDKRVAFIVKRLTIEKTTDILSNLVGGMYQSELLTHDIVRKKYKTYTFNYEDDFDDKTKRSKHLSPHTLHNREQTDFVTGSSKDFFIGTSIGRNFAEYVKKDTFTKPHLMENFVQKRNSTLSRFNNFVAIAEIPGDSHRVPGDVIEIVIPSPSGLHTETPLEDKYFTGKFLVTQVRHKITAGIFTTVLQVIKESFNEKIEKVDANVKF